MIAKECPPEASEAVKALYEERAKLVARQAELQKKREIVQKKYHKIEEANCMNNLYDKEVKEYKNRYKLAYNAVQKVTSDLNQANWAIHEQILKEKENGINP